MTTFPEARRYKPKYKVLIGLLSIASGVYAGLFYAADALSERDYSRIADPQLRVGYCMATNTFNPEKYLLAETTVRAPEFNLYSAVSSYALAGVITDQKKAALLALRERDESRARAVRTSFRIADRCGYRKIAWPAGTTPLDINMRWLRHDKTFLYFLEKIRTEPDAADRVYGAQRRLGAAARAAQS